MKTTALFWKSMLTLPSLVGFALGCPSAPGLAEDVPVLESQSMEAQSVPDVSVNNGPYLTFTFRF